MGQAYAGTDSGSSTGSYPDQGTPHPIGTSRASLSYTNDTLTA